MWNLGTPWYELIMRSLLVFIFLFSIFRIWGKKHFAQLTSFDFILLLIISEAIQNALVGDDHSVAGGFITVGTLVFMNVFMDKLTFRSKRMEKLIDGTETVLIKDGKLDHAMMVQETITMGELMGALRAGGVLTVEEVRQATLETDGDISVVPMTR